MHTLVMTLETARAIRHPCASIDSVKLGSRESDGSLFRRFSTCHSLLTSHISIHQRRPGYIIACQIHTQVTDLIQSISFFENRG